MKPQFGVYRPTRKITKPGKTATFLGLLFSSDNVIDAIKFEFDYQQDTGSEESLVIAEAEKLPPYVLGVSVTLAGEANVGWQERAWEAFGMMPILDDGGQEYADGGFKKIFLPNEKSPDAGATE